MRSISSCTCPNWVSCLCNFNKKVFNLNSRITSNKPLVESVLKTALPISFSCFEYLLATARMYFFTCPGKLLYLIKLNGFYLSTLLCLYLSPKILIVEFMICKKSIFVNPSVFDCSVITCNSG